MTERIWGSERFNVGTIGHIDHGKATPTAANLADQATKGFARPKSEAAR